MREVWLFIYANARVTAYVVLLVCFVAGAMFGAWAGKRSAYRKKPSIDFKAIERRAGGYEVMRERLGVSLDHNASLSRRIVLMKRKIAVMALFLGKAITESKIDEE